MHDIADLEIANSFAAVKRKLAERQGLDAVDRSNLAAVPDAASAACEVALSFSWLRRNRSRGKLSDASAGSLSFLFCARLFNDRLAPAENVATQ